MIEFIPNFAASIEISNLGQGLTAVEKISNKNAVGVIGKSDLHAGSSVGVKAHIVGAEDTTGLRTSQELEAMAATVISPTVDGAYESGCHTASVLGFKNSGQYAQIMKFCKSLVY